MTTEWAYVAAGVAVGAGIVAHACIIGMTVQRIGRHFVLH